MPSQSSKRSLAKTSLRYHNNLLDPSYEQAFTYLHEERGLSPETIDEYKLGVVGNSDEDHEALAGYISIPFLTPTSRTDRALNYTDLRFRRGPDLPDTKPKYRTLPGRPPRLFSTTTLANPSEYVAIVEGEIDCMTLNQCGIPAVGVSGVSAWKDHYRNIFSGFERVIVVADNDEPKEGESLGVGEKFAEEVAKNVPNPKVVVVPEGGDANGFYLLNGAVELRHLLGV